MSSSAANSAEIFYLPSGCDCDGTDYSQSSIEAACQEALVLASQGRTEGKDKCRFLFFFSQLSTLDSNLAFYLHFSLAPSSPPSGISLEQTCHDIKMESHPPSPIPHSDQ